MVHIKINNDNFHLRKIHRIKLGYETLCQYQTFKIRGEM